MIFLLRTSGQLIQKVARLGLKAPPIDFQSNLTSPPKKKSNPTGPQDDSAGSKRRLDRISRRPNDHKAAQQIPPKRLCKLQKAAGRNPSPPSRHPRHQLHSVPSSASKPLSSKTLQQKTLQNDCSVLYKLFPFRLCHSTVPWTWQRRV